MDVRGSRGGNELVLGRLGPRVEQVVADRRVKEERVLEDDVTRSNSISPSVDASSCAPRRSATSLGKSSAVKMRRKSASDPTRLTCVSPSEPAAMPKRWVSTVANTNTVPTPWSCCSSTGARIMRPSSRASASSWHAGGRRPSFGCVGSNPTTTRSACGSSARRACASTGATSSRDGDHERAAQTRRSGELELCSSRRTGVRVLRRTPAAVKGSR
jgi:hypothetical protein